MPRTLVWLVLAAAVVALVPLAWLFARQGFEAGLRRPALFVAAYAALVPFGSAIALPLPLPGPFRTLSTLAGGVAMLVAAAHLASRSRPASQHLPPALPVWLLLLGLAAVSVLWSVNPVISASDVVVLTSLVGLYALAVLLPWSRRDVRLLEHAVVAGGAGTGLYALLLLVTGNMPTEGPAPYRFHTAGGGGEGLGDPNITAASLLLPLALAVHEALRSRGRPRALALLAAVLIGVAIVLTGSRGGLVGAGLAVLLIAWDDGRTRVWVTSLVAAAGILLVVVVIAPESIGERLAVQSSTGRAAIWETAVRTCPSTCLTGAGYGAFADVHERQLLHDPAAPGGTLRFVAHNIWLQAIVELGVAGVTLLTLGIVLVLRGLLARPRGVRGGALAGLVAVVVSNFFLSNFGFKYFWLALLYATVVACAPATSDDGTLPARTRAGAGRT